MLSINGKCKVVMDPKVLGNGEWKVVIIRIVESRKNKDGSYDSSFLDVKWFTKDPVNIKKGDTIWLYNATIMTNKFTRKDGTEGEQVMIVVGDRDLMVQAQTNIARQAGPSAWEDTPAPADSPFDDTPTTGGNPWD